jgi:Lhr-like helicase/RecB family exonuclease
MSSPPSSSDGRSSSAFHQLHSGVQRWIWEKGWRELRPIQEWALEPILAGRDVVLAAPTAGGKTEAAFLPIVSRLAGEPPLGIGCLCVSPLKALINDQFGRLEELCGHAKVPVSRWHGDVDATAKRALLDRPAGILLITPESLEALFVLQGPRIVRLFGALGFVVVDELHAFFGTERGRQLQSLLHRVELAVRRHVPRVALSATIGDLRLAAEFLRPGHGADVVCIESTDDARELRLQVRGYKKTAPRLTPNDVQLAEGEGRAVTTEDIVTGDVRDIADHIFGTLRGSDNLIFANSRRVVEQLADILGGLSEQARVPNEFLPHHGSLARDLREDAEAVLKDSTRPGNVVCTTTLELGLDIGSVDSIAQIGAPPSVAALRQRLGRSGRRQGAPAVLRVYVAEESVTPETALEDTLRTELVQTIAMVDLLLERFCELPLSGKLHLSTLVQQVLSVIAQHGGVKPREAWKALCASGPFSATTSEIFAEVLRCLGAKEMISQDHDASLVIGAAGERLVDHYSFYAAFDTPEEYRLVTKERTLGSMPITTVVLVGMHLIFAGRRWRVESLDEERKVIDLTPAGGGRPPKFTGTGAPVGDEIREKMLEVYRSDIIPAYLDATARELLREGRQAFCEAGLERDSLISSGQGTLVFPWVGDRVMNTLQILFLDRGLRAENRGVAFHVDGAAPDVVQHQLEVIGSAKPADPLALAALVANKRLEKYDGLLSEDLLCRDYASRSLDVVGARDAARVMVLRNTGFEGTARVERTAETRQESQGRFPTKVIITSTTEETVGAILGLPATGALPARTVLAPNNRVAHALRRELILSGTGGRALAGTRFIPAVAAAVEVLRGAGVSFDEGEEILRPRRLLAAFRTDLELRYFDLRFIRETPGWEEAFASTIGELEGAGLSPQELPADGGRLDDLKTVWSLVDGSADGSWTRARILLEAASVLQRDPGSWPFDGPILAFGNVYANAAEARFLRALPGVTLALVPARPLRARYLERAAALFGEEVARLLNEWRAPRKSKTERDVLASYLFEPPEMLADPSRARSSGLDSTVYLEEHAGVESEIEAAADWVARQVLEKGRALEEIAVLVPTLDPLAAMAAERIARLPWGEGTIPVHVAGGVPLITRAAGARAIAVIRAFRRHLAADAVASVLPVLRLHGEERSHLSTGRALDLVYSLGTVGGNPAEPRGALEWSARAEARERALEALVRGVAEAGDDPAQAGLARQARDFERLLEDLRAVRPALDALVEVARLVVDRHPLAGTWPALREFMKQWLLSPGEGVAPWMLLDETLGWLANDPSCVDLVGEDALRVIEETALTTRVSIGRFGDPSVFVGTIASGLGLGFKTVRILGLHEGTIPSVPREDAVLPSPSRLGLGHLLPDAADRATAQLHALDRVVRETREEVVLSSPRFDLERSEHEPSSIFVEVAAALGRGDATGSKALPAIPGASAIRRHCYQPAQRDLRKFRIGTPITESAWQDRVSRQGPELPSSWCGRKSLDLVAIGKLLDGSALGPLDGIFGNEEGIPILPGVTLGYPISASRLQKLLRCPQQFLLEAVVGWDLPAAPPAQREIDTLAYGGLLHLTAERFFRAHGADFSARRLTLEEWQRRGEELSRQLFAEFTEQYPLVGEMVCQQQLARLQRDFRTFLEYDWAGGQPRVLHSVEQPFGVSEPVELPLSTGSLFLRGFIDRIDVEDGMTLVRDLKSGRSHPRVGKEAEADPDRDVQIALYGMVARIKASEWNLPNRVAAAYAYVDGRGESERSFRMDFPMLEAAATKWLEVASGLLRGRFFPRTPRSEDCEYCAFPAVCGVAAQQRAATILDAASDPALVAFRALKAPTENAEDEKE